MVKVVVLSFKIIGLFLVAFVVQGLLRSGFQQAVGQRILEASSWTPGSVPPSNYMVMSVLAALVATTIAGIVVALLMGRTRIRVALSYGALITGLGVWSSRATLFSSPHPEEWPLILAPLIAMPLGAWLIVQLKPLNPEGAQTPLAN
jgi:hypothetical protein